MDFQNLLIFTLFLIIISFVVFLICKIYFENKNKNNNEINILQDEKSQITELKGAVAQLSISIEERLGNIGSSIGNSLNQQTQNTQKSLTEMHERLAVIDLIT